MLLVLMVKIFFQFIIYILVVLRKHFNWLIRIWFRVKYFAVMWIINKPIVNLITVLQVIKCQVSRCFKNTFFLNNCTLTIHVRSLVDWWQNLNHTQTKTFSTCYCHANFYHTSTKQNTFLIFIVSKVGDSTDFWVLLVIMIYIQIEKRL